MDWIGRRGDATVGHDLYELCAALDLLARCQADLALAVDDPADGAEPPFVRSDGALVEPAAEVPVAASLRQRLSAYYEPRAKHRALLDCGDESAVGTSDVAHGREAAHQHAVHGARGPGRDQAVGKHITAAEARDAGDDMHMAVDQPRHKRLALKIDPAGARRRDWIRRNLLYETFNDPDMTDIAEFAGLDIENARIGQD